MFHLVIRKGSAASTRLEFPDSGSETAELLPGDVVFVLREARFVLRRCAALRASRCVLLLVCAGFLGASLAGGSVCAASLSLRRDARELNVCLPRSPLPRTTRHNAPRQRTTRHQKPQSEYQRDGPKNLVRAGAPIKRGDAWYCEGVRGMSGRRCAVLWCCCVLL